MAAVDGAGDADKQSEDAHDSDDDFAALLEAELDGSAGLAAQSLARPAQPQDSLASPRSASRASKRRRVELTASPEAVCPPHPGTMHGICIRCGIHVSDEGDNVALRYIHQGLQLSRAEAERMRTEGLQRATGMRKFLLVLDLDHTLLNSTRFAEVPPEFEALLHEMLANEDQGSEKTLYRLPHLLMWTKLRPNVREFLAAAHALAEVHIYTHGDRNYAAAMARLLDPGKRLFGDRVISQGDSTQKGVKHLDVVLGAESAVVIVDDTEGVWPKHRDNLILVDRYIFFPADAIRFMRQPSLLERRADESKVDGQLATALRTLQELHRRVFSREGQGKVDLDVRLHLGRLKQEVLRDVHLCFTKLIPVGEAEPERHHLWLLANKLGATCSLRLEDTITHVVAGSSRTDKALLAQAQGIPVVSPDWLFACAFLWERVSEDRYPAVEEANLKSAALDPRADLEAALEAAGGGRGVQTTEKAVTMKSNDASSPSAS